MKPKNDEEKNRKKCNFVAQKPSKMRSKIQKILSKKMIEKYAEKGRHGQLSVRGKGFAPHVGGNSPWPGAGELLPTQSALFWFLASKMGSKCRTDLIIWWIWSKIDRATWFWRQKKPRSSKICRKWRKTDVRIRKSENFFRKKIFGVKKSKVANRLKRVLPKFRGDRSDVRRVRGRLGGILEA